MRASIDPQGALLVTDRAAPRRWDIFCVAVDNYGDVGVTWRVARQLAGEHGATTRLFVDALGVLSRIASGVDPERARQSAHGVEVLRWDGPLRELPTAARVDPGDVIVEAFGCGLPEAYLAAMCERSAQPLWINLEYLSAEDWIEGCHGLASRQPRLPLTRHFYFPGFTPRSGGLPRERDLFARRDAFRADPQAQSALWQTLRVDIPVPAALKVSLFCYPNAPLTALLDAWSAGEDAVVCLVPEGAASAAIEDWAGRALGVPGESLRRGGLTLARVPFVAQDDYDRLLWACDLNFVRGEDSFLRAQWAARPLVWHCYPQGDRAHLAKLDAFLARYGEGLAPRPLAAQTAFARAWNEGRAAAPAWGAFAGALPALRTHAQAWADALGAQEDLASRLVKFAVDRV